MFQTILFIITNLFTLNTIKKFTGIIFSKCYVLFNTYVSLDNNVTSLYCIQPSYVF